MRITGIILIVFVVVIYALWVWFTKNKQGIKAKSEGDIQVFDIVVRGVYSPDVMRVKTGKPVRMNFIRKESTECSRFVRFPDFKIRKELPEGKTVAIEFTPDRKGEFVFTCDMSMYQGRLIVE